MADDYDLLSETTIWSLMDIGFSFARIGQIRARRKLGPTRSDPLGLVERIQDFCDSVESLQLPKSIELAHRLRRGHLAKLEKALIEDPGAVLYRETAKGLKATLDTLWDRVSDETSRQAVYVVTSLRYRRLTEFTESPRRTFGLEEGYEPPFPQALDANLEEAKRCLSVGLAGAATFFLLRATEVVLKHYYRLVTREEPGPNPWGTLCRYLDEPGCDAPSQLVDVIRELKNEYRDPMIHVTESELEPDEKTAFEVLNLCGDVVGQMMNHLETVGKIRSYTGSPDELEFSEE